jgi:hypothetical protein
MKTWITDQLITFFIYTQFRYLRYRANQLHKLTGKRYFVIPISSYRLKVINNDNVTRYNQGARRKDRTPLKFLDVEKQCFYCTSLGTTGARNTKHQFDVKKRLNSLLNAK